MTKPCVGPYAGVQFDRLIEHPRGRRFRVITYQALHAGIMGFEHNGIAVLNERPRNILCDEIGQVESGYFGVTRAQWALAIRICRMPWEHFEHFINSHPRRRYSL